MKKIAKLLFPSVIVALLLVGCQKKTSSQVESNSNTSEDSSFSSEPFEELPELNVDSFNRTYEKVSSNSAYVRQVNGLTPSNFILGMDASSVIVEENSGVKYYDFNGQEQDVFKVLSDNGVNYIRVRIWNDPFDANGHGYGGGNNDLATAIKIGKRATQYKMSLLVDFHYSDFWADPSKQMVPKAWADMSISEKTNALYEFTKDSLQALKNENITVGMVQIGNETNLGNMAGSSGFNNFVKLAGAGSRAVREVLPNALVAVHFTNPEKADSTGNAPRYLEWAERIKSLDYDVFGTSYYPYWHGTLENLGHVLTEVSGKYHKYTMVMETSYANTTIDTDGQSNTIGETSGYDVKNYPFTMHGQINSVIDVIDTVKNHSLNGIGVCYWEGTWISVGDTTKSDCWESNHQKWEQYGSGWATSYAADYDPDDAGKYYGGTAVDNQAFFDASGHPYESLKLFNLVRFGNEIEKAIDGVEDVYLIKYDSEQFTLPETVNVIYTDNSKAPISVTWDAFDLEAAKAAGNAKYDIHGVAGGQDVYCHLTIMEYNYIQNYSFEEGLSPWTLNIERGVANYIKITNENPQTGKSVFHFWDSEGTGVKFTLEQQVNVGAGTYKLQFSHLAGGNSSSPTLAPAKQNNLLYVKVNGSIASSKAFNMKNWDSGFIDELLTGISIPANAEVVVGILVDITQAGCWGGIEDVMLNRSAS